jgi:hypothetical protein
VSHYERCDIGHPDRSYTFLYKALMVFLDRKRTRENRQNVTSALAKVHGGTPAMPASGKGDRRGNGNGKGNGRCAHRAVAVLQYTCTYTRVPWYSSTRVRTRVRTSVWKTPPVGV